MLTFIWAGRGKAQGQKFETEYCVHLDFCLHSTTPSPTLFSPTSTGLTNPSKAADPVRRRWLWLFRSRGALEFKSSIPSIL